MYLGWWLLGTGVGAHLMMMSSECTVMPYHLSIEPFFWGGGGKFGMTLNPNRVLT